MLPVSAASFAVLALSAQYLAPAAALSGDALQTYTEWKQSSYYTEAVKVAVTYGAVSRYSSSTKTGVSNSTTSSGSVASNVTITSSSSSSSSTDVGISETEEQERFDQALTVIAKLKKLHPYGNFSVNTPFALLTADEFLAYVNRYAVDPSSSAFQVSTSTSTTASSDGGPLTTDAQSFNSSVASSEDGGPMTSSAASGETVDWEDAGCVTAVKDQGECGACWAFSATAAMESGYCVATGGSLLSLADQELVSCDVDGENNGCGGGYAAYTIDWIANERNGKMCTLDTYPFASGDGDVPSCAMSSCTEADIGVTGYESLREDAGALEDAVRSHPVSVFMYSGSSAFQYYSGGVLTGENCDKTGSHSALAVGFGETDDGVLYWRIKNQWGTDWGEEGYVRVERRYSGDNDGACGVELYATWPTFDVTSTISSADTSSSVDSASAPSATNAASTTAPSSTTATPSVTTKTPTTITPSATKGAVVADSTTESPSATKAAQSQAGDQTVSSGSSGDGVTIYTIEAPTAAPMSATTAQAEDQSVAGEASYSTTTTPATTVQDDAAQNDQSASVTREATTPSPSNRDCAM